MKYGSDAAQLSGETEAEMMVFPRPRGRWRPHLEAPRRLDRQGLGLGQTLSDEKCPVVIRSKCCKNHDETLSFISSKLFRRNWDGSNTMRVWETMDREERSERHSTAPQSRALAPSSIREKTIQNSHAISKFRFRADDVVSRSPEESPRR